jgi:two-component SAPR family response regulator
VAVTQERTISIRTFGDFELAFDGHPVRRWKAGKACSLLQFLLLRPGRVVPGAVLYESLWPNAPWSKESSSLKVAVHMLRTILEHGDGDRPAAGPALRLLTCASGYLLEVDRVAIDFEDFGRLADQAYAAQLRDDSGAAAALYRRAVAFYRGDFLPDAEYDWAAMYREWLRSRLLCAYAFLTEADLVRGDHAGAIRWCQRTLDVDPFHEQSYCTLILVLAHLGYLAQARRWYRLCVAQLREHLHVAPELATQRVYTRAMRGEFTGRPLHPAAWRHQFEVGGRGLPSRQTA